MTTNSTGWFPHCTSSLALKHSGTAAAAVTTKTISRLICIPFKDQLVGYNKKKKDDPKSKVCKDIPFGCKFNEFITPEVRRKLGDAPLVVGTIQLLAGDFRKGTMFNYTNSLTPLCISGKTPNLGKCTVPYAGWISRPGDMQLLSRALDELELAMANNPGFAQAVKSILLDPVMECTAFVTDDNGDCVDNPASQRCWILLDQCTDGASMLRTMLNKLRSASTTSANAPVVGHFVPPGTVTFTTKTTTVDMPDIYNLGKGMVVIGADGQPVQREKTSTRDPNHPITLND